MAGNHLQARLRVHWPNGGYRGFILQPSRWELAVPFNDVPSLTVEYHDNAKNQAYLNNPVEVALEVFNPRARRPDGTPYGSGAYQEFPGCRFLNLRQSGDLMTGTESRNGTWTYTMPGYPWMLKKSKNILTSKFDKKDKSRRKFTKSTVGGILKQFLSEARSRKNLSGITWSFNATTDSAGRRWGDTYDLSFDAGQDILSILEDFTRKGMCDWRMDKRTLQVYKPDTYLARDRTGRDGSDPELAVVLRPHFDVLREPTDVTREDLARRILVKGDKNIYRSIIAEPNAGPWGAWEEYVTAGGWTSKRALDSIARAALAARRGNGKPHGQRAQLTKELHVREGSKLPLVQYRPGDYVLGPMYRPIIFNDPDPWVSKVARLRVQQITLTYQEPYGISGNVVLNDKFADRELRKERWLARVSEI
jgi:hypothetical protein